MHATRGGNRSPSLRRDTVRSTNRSAPKLKRLPMAAAANALLALTTAGLAHAHVTVLPREVPPDSSQTFTVRVPTEKEEPTVRVRIEFPAGLVVSRFQPKGGWSRQVERDGQQRITAVTWSGGQIAPDEYEDFAFIGRTPREPGALAFKAYQSYQGGETVEWVNAEGEERPAALVAVKAAVTSTEDPEGLQGLQPGAKPGGPTEGPRVASAQTGGSDLPLIIALASGVLALIAVILAGVALATRPRSL